MQGFLTSKLHVKNTNTEYNKISQQIYGNLKKQLIPYENIDEKFKKNSKKKV